MSQSINPVRVVRADYANPVHAAAVVMLLDAYASDPMGGGEPLSEFAKAKLCGLGVLSNSATTRRQSSKENFAVDSDSVCRSMPARVNNSSVQAFRFPSTTKCTLSALLRLSTLWGSEKLPYQQVPAGK